MATSVKTLYSCYTHFQKPNKTQLYSNTLNYLNQIIKIQFQAHFLNRQYPLRINLRWNHWVKFILFVTARIALWGRPIWDCWWACTVWRHPWFKWFFHHYQLLFQREVRILVFEENFLYFCSWLILVFHQHRLFWFLQEFFLACLQAFWFRWRIFELLIKSHIECLCSLLLLAILLLSSFRLRENHRSLLSNHLLSLLNVFLLHLLDLLQLFHHFPCYLNLSLTKLKACQIHEQTQFCWFIHFHRCRWN